MRPFARIGVPLAAAALMLSACSSPEGGKTADNTATSKTTTTKETNKPKADRPQAGSTVTPDTFSKKVGAAMSKVKTFKTETTGTMTIGGTTKSIKSTLVVDISDSESPKGHMVGDFGEVILIGKDSYVKIYGQEKFKKMNLDSQSLPQLPNIQQNQEDYYSKIFAEANSITYVGEEKLDGKSIYHYKIEQTKTEKSLPTPNDIYLDDKDRVVKVKVKVEGSTPFNTEAVSSNFNEKVTIQAPPADQIA